MKTLVYVWIAVLSFAVLAQESSKLDKASQNYEKALKSENSGVVESAIFHSVKFKLFYPEYNTENLSKALNHLVREGETTEIRYKAYLAEQFINNAALMAKIEKQDYKDGDSFFKLLADELQREFLANN